MSDVRLTELERAFCEVPAETRDAYLARCRERAERPSPVGLLNFAWSGKPLPPDKRAELQRYMNQIARELLAERIDRDAASAAHDRGRARD